MAKKIVGFIKLQIPAGKANPSPPVGPALGQRGLNIMEFCKAFNAQTQGVEPGLMLPVVITAFADKSFTLHHQDAARGGADQEGDQAREGLGQAAPRQGRQDHARADRGNREGQDEGPDGRRARCRGEDDRRLRALDGRDGGRSLTMAKLDETAEDLRRQGRQQQALSAGAGAVDRQGMRDREVRRVDRRRGATRHRRQEE